MAASLSIQGSSVPKIQHSRFSLFSRLFSKKGFVKSLKAILPVVVLAAFFPEMAIAGAAGGRDLMSTGDATVGKTFGSTSSIVKWVILSEVIVGGIMYMMTKNVKFLAGFAILSVFIAIGMSVAGY